MPNNYSLTIFLINRDLEHDAVISKIRQREYRNFDIGNYRYHVYAKRKYENLPKWAPFFDNHLNDDFVWPTSAPGLVVLIDVDERTFALTFGHGKTLLIPDCWEDRFGLKVVLNTIEKVKSLSKKSFDAIQGQTQTQANDFTDVEQFGFDVERDLLKAVTGKPDDTDTFGQRLSGADALVTTVEVDLQSLPALLQRYLGQSELLRYRERFAFVDHLRAIEGSTLKTQLEGHLLTQLRTRLEQLATNRAADGFPFDLVVPQVVDWDRVSEFGYGINRLKNPARHDLTIDSFLAYFADKSRGQVSMDGLRRTEVLALDGDGAEVHRWSGYRCLTGGLQVDTKRYVLSDKKWYEVDSDYVTDLERFVAEIPPYAYAANFPLYSGGREKTYNESIANLHAGFFCLDGKMVRPMTNQQVEFCDIYTETQDDRRDLIHVKRGKSSAVLSHLFAQGTTSAELYSVYDVCRTQAENLVRRALGDDAYDRQGRPDKIRTVYAIIRSRAGTLPFFSKVNLKRACQDMKRSGIEYALAEIEYDPEYRVIR